VLWNSSGAGFSKGELVVAELLRKSIDSLNPTVIKKTLDYVIARLAVKKQVFDNGSQRHPVKADVLQNPLVPILHHHTS